MGFERNVNNKVLADYQSYHVINLSSTFRKSIVMLQQIFDGHIYGGLFMTLKPNKK